MNSGLWRFVRGLAVWEGIVFLPIGIELLRGGATWQYGDLKGALPIAFCGVPIIVVCSLLSGKVGPVASVLLGALIGVIFMIAGGFLWAQFVVRGFEASAGTFGVSIMLSIPSGVGSGVASWLNSRRSLPD
jgi:hypothetical protein